MDVIRFGLGIRALRRRRRWTQARLATESRVSRAVIWRIERGRADRVAVHTIVRVAAALGAQVDVRLLWQGEGLDRLLDARHAGLVERVVELLASNAWEVATEVSFNIRGERGSIDILAFHPATGSLLVIEVKSVVPDMQAMLVAIDRKGRLAHEIARDRGWRVVSVTRMLVLPDERTARRRVEEQPRRFEPPSQHERWRSSAGSASPTGRPTASCSWQMHFSRALVTELRALEPGRSRGERDGPWRHAWNPAIVRSTTHLTRRT